MQKKCNYSSDSGEAYGRLCGLNDIRSAFRRPL